jgi:hypothetical protein
MIRPPTGEGEDRASTQWQVAAKVGRGSISRVTFRSWACNSVFGNATEAVLLDLEPRLALVSTTQPGLKSASDGGRLCGRFAIAISSMRDGFHLRNGADKLVRMPNLRIRRACSKAAECSESAKTLRRQRPEAKLRHKISDSDRVWVQNQRPSAVCQRSRLAAVQLAETRRRTGNR